MQTNTKYKKFLAILPRNLSYDIPDRYPYCVPWILGLGHLVVVGYSEFNRTIVLLVVRQYYG